MTEIGRAPDRLFQLMPALYRITDADQGHVLEALLGLVNEQADMLRDDAERLWDDFFIETCQHWVVPYLGDLVGTVPLIDPDMRPAAATAESLFTDLTGPSLAMPSPIRSRADVARTIAHRRRKGTPAMLEELAGDVTGWGALVSEFFQRLAWTQYLEHLRPQAPGTPDLRSVDADRRRAGPWDRAQHVVDVRAISGGEGWYNIPHVGIFVWRLLAQPRTRVTPRRVGAAAWRRTFSPLGQDVTIFSAGDAAPFATGRTREDSLQTPLRAAAFFADLSSVPGGTGESSRWYGPRGAARLVVYDGNNLVPASLVHCANLSAWTSFPRPTGLEILVDPTRGRLAVPDQREPADIRVSFCEGFSAFLGGGEYQRASWLVDTTDGPVPIEVSGGGAALQTALVGRPTAPETVIRVVDNASYGLTSPLTLQAGERLTIEAADKCRPHVRLTGGDLTVGTAATDTAASLTLGGLLVEGGLVVTGDLRTLRLLHCTLVPGRTVLPGSAITGPSLLVNATAGGATVNARLEVQIAASIVGALRLPKHVAGLWLLDCLVDGITQDGADKGVAISDTAGTSGPVAHLERTTVLGSAVFGQAPLISESVLTHDVSVGRRQEGCVRFSYVTTGSRTPRKYRCQPGLAITAAQDRRRREADQAGIELPAGWEAPVAAAVAARVVPAFTSEQYGRPGYGQLHDTCPVEIATGAEDGAEMGVFSQLKNAQREANLRRRLDEYLPVGLEARLIHQY